MWTMKLLHKKEVSPDLSGKQSILAWSVILTNKQYLDMVAGNSSPSIKTHANTRPIHHNYIMREKIGLIDHIHWQIYLCIGNWGLLDALHTEFLFSISWSFKKKWPNDLQCCFGIRGCGFKPPTNACRYIICKYVDQKEVSVAPKKDLWKIGKIYGWRPPWEILDPPLLTFDCEGQPRVSVVTFA